MKNRWMFPHGKDLTPRGVNDPAINSFLDNVIDSLTREVIQNSLDAKIKENNNPVEVTFDEGVIKTEEIPGIEDIRDALPKAIHFWEKKGNVGTLNHLRGFEKLLNSETVRILKVSDYNAYGLNDKSYDALIIGNGYTEKIDENAAGSKGIGKAAPFAISDLRLVFYNTVPTKSIPKHAGVMNFVSFNFDENDESIITQERALYQTEDKDHVTGQISFNFDERKLDEYGTDLFIIGLREIDDDWEKRILLSAVNNFLVSILEKKLIIRVNKTILNHENLGEVIALLGEFKKSYDEKKVFKDTINYFDALTNQEKLEFELDERFDKYDFIKSKADGKLVLLKREEANRMILQTRISGMKIYDRDRISGNIMFTGVFRATGKELDKFLKSLENTNHTGWSPDQSSKENRKQAEEFLKDLYHWFKETVKNSYEQSVENVIDAIGIKDFLPLVSQQEGKQDEQADTGIKKTIDNVVIKRNTRKNNIYNTYEFAEDGVDSIIEELGYDTEETKVEKETKKTRKIKHLLEKISLRRKLKKEQLVDADEFFGVKIIALNTSGGLYRCILKPTKSFKEIDIKFNIVGEDGRITATDVRNVKSNTNKMKKNDSMIRLYDVKKGELATIDININSKLLLKMKGKIYEVKI